MTCAGMMTDLEAVGVREDGAQPLVEAIGIEARVGPELLGGLLQLGKIARPGLDEIMHRVARDSGGPSQRRRRAFRRSVAETLCNVRRVLQQVAVGAEEADDGIAQRRACLGRVADVLIAHLAACEQRIAEDLPELSGDPPFVVLREALKVDVEGLAELEQEGNRHRALAALDQIEVTRGDSELRCHARLGQPALPAEPAHPLACHDLALHGLLRIVATAAPRARPRNFTEFTAPQQFTY